MSDNAHIQAPSAGTVDGVSTPPVGPQLLLSNLVPAGHPTPLSTTVCDGDTGVTRFPNAPHSPANPETVPRTPLTDAGSTGQRSPHCADPRGQNDSSATLPDARARPRRKFMGWVNDITSLLICVGRVFSCVDDIDNMEDIGNSDDVMSRVFSSS
ncbi:hypothetical protein ARMGADRAFT_216175 [Armillaria gallica]|uniref:Uncharacterized protein n=1 Tax=Armillaria gallica TaxID=47427 RepID=A0A2H3DJQ9_ARMGA|nr:hypothetical protein ARMGADRAFT_216175 [Armillaria gallica]